MVYAVDDFHVAFDQDAADVFLQGRGDIAENADKADRRAGCVA